jgi:MFS family permease
MILLFTKVPTPPKIIHIYHDKAKMTDILKDRNLLNMVIINAMQKGLMTMAFVLIPIILVGEEYGFGWEKAELWKVYIPAMVAGLVAMGPAAVFGEKHNKPKQIFLISIVLFVISFLVMGLTTSSTVFIFGVIAFFIAFNMMEPLVQSMISKFAKVHQKGAALGVANSAAYFSTFIGGSIAGLLIGTSDRGTIGISVAIIAAIWLLWTFTLQNPIKHSHLITPIVEIDMDKLKELEHEHIAEWFINDTEKVVIVKYNAEKLNEDDLKSKIYI